ncbi:hypothetical protein ABIA23_003479 [Sinorhizobium fredii]
MQRGMPFLARHYDTRYGRSRRCAGDRRSRGRREPVSGGDQAVSDSDHSVSAAMTPGSAAMREMTVSAPASVSLSACEG